MELVTDTNVLLSALLKPSTTQKILFSGKIKAFAPEYCLTEIEKHSEEFAKRMGKTKHEFGVAVAVIFSEINIIPSSEYEQVKEKAMKMLSDKKDWPFLALALSMRLPIWSNDKGFKEQSEIKVFNTKELINELTG